MHIRAATPEDLPRLTDIYNHFVRESYTTFDTDVFSVEARRAWFDKFADHGRYRLLVGDVDGDLVGYASSQPLRPKPAYDQSVETTVYLAPEFVGFGYGETLYRALLDLLSARDDVHRAYGVIAMPNDGSVRLHEKLGFRHVGTLSEVGYKFGKYWDTAWFERNMR